jgi:hypothetical protein
MGLKLLRGTVSKTRIESRPAFLPLWRFGFAKPGSVRINQSVQAAELAGAGNDAYNV